MRKMLGLGFLLGLNLSSEASSYCVGAMTAINRQVDRHRSSVKLEAIKGRRGYADGIADLLEIYYFNERGLGLLIRVDEVEDKLEETYQLQAKILYLAEEEVTDGEINRDRWWNLIRQMIRQGPQPYLQKLRRPADWHPLTEAEEMRLAWDLSEVLKERKEGEIIRGNNGIWHLKYFPADGEG